MFRTLFAGKEKTAVRQMNAQELNDHMQSASGSLLLVDVRTPGEYQYDGHIAGSRLLPLNNISQRADELPRDKTIVCVCRSGARSQTACEMLSKHGFDVINLRGGMIGWKRAGLPHN